MIVCVCHRVSERDIQAEVQHGCASFEELQEALRVATGCGRCGDCARETFDACLASAGIPARRVIALSPVAAPVAPVAPASPAVVQLAA